MKILVIDNYDSFTFNLVQMIEQISPGNITIIKNNNVDLNKINNFDKILFTPGPGVPKDAPIMSEIITEYGNKKSILGICLGHQAIAEHFGCTLENNEEVFHGVSKKIHILERNYLFKGAPAAFNSGLYHSWTVSKENIPECITVSAVSEDGNIMAVSHKEYDIKGLQFHPESIMTKWGRVIISNWLEEIKAKA